MKLLSTRIAVLSTVVVLAIVGLIAAYALGASRSNRTEVGTSSSKLENKANITEKDMNQLKPLEEDTISILACGVDKSEKLTDVIMYAVFNTRDKTVNILRIPRDSFVGSEFPTGKVNAIYGHPGDGMTGIETLTNYLKDNWKLGIDYYATISLDGMRNIIDSLGGIKMNVEQTIDYLPGKVLYPGEQVLNGEQSEWIIRYRAGYQDGDIGRIDTQTKFLGACIDTAKEVGRLKCLSVLAQNYSEVKTDMPLDKMLAVAGSLLELDKSNLNMFVVPGNGTMYYSYSVYAVDKEKLLTILNENFMPETSQLTAADLTVASTTGGNKNYNYNYNNGSSTGGNSDTQQNQQTQPGTGEEGFQQQKYQYDEFGNPLYELDAEGNPIYQYDDSGNVVYIYQMVEQESNQPTDQGTESPQTPEVDQPSGNNQNGNSSNGTTSSNQNNDSQDNQGTEGSKIIKKKDGATTQQNGTENQGDSSESGNDTGR